MANTASMPTEGQFLVNIEDMSLLKDIKKAISMVKGVGKITMLRRRMTSYERSLRDLDEGRVYEAKDVDDLFKQCLGWPTQLATRMGATWQRTGARDAEYRHSLRLVRQEQEVVYINMCYFKTDTPMDG